LAAGVVALGIGIAVVACGGGAAPTPSPTPLPTPVVTPDPHLHEPVTADQIYAYLTAAKLGMTCANANLGNGNPAIIKQINCSIGGWPLRITQYSSGAILDRSLDWVNGQAPHGDEAPYGWAGLNVAVQFGPISDRAPGNPPADRQTVAGQIVGVLDPLLWPLKQHSVLAVPARTPEPPPAPSVSAAPTKAPTKAPAKTPKPSRTP
jgi:hypothetical protein